jgi:hypothetical protein
MTTHSFIAVAPTPQDTQAPKQPTTRMARVKETARGKKALGSKKASLLTLKVHDTQFIRKLSIGCNQYNTNVCIAPLCE